LPSTRTPGNPYPSARRQISPAVCDAVGTLIAQPLFWQNRTSGRRRTPARFAASWKSPSLVAPSPKYAIVTSPLPSSCRPSAYPAAWAISEPIERQSRIPLYQRALGFGFPGVRVDGNDVLAVHEVAGAAVRRARTGGGPTLMFNGYEPQVGQLYAGMDLKKNF
jgi:hypothetical protein